MMRKYIPALAILLAALLFFGCVNPPQPPANNTSVMTPANNSTAVIQSDDTADIGDNVSVDYTLWVDGKVVDTTSATVANESGIYSPRRVYAPFNFTLGFDQGLIQGFVINIVGMRVNETVTFDVDPSRGYGSYDPRKVVVIPRYYNMSIIETLPLEAVGLNSSSNVSKGDGFNTPYGDTAFIQEINGDNVTLVHMFEANQSLSFNGIPMRVLGVNNLTAYIEWAFQVNQTYLLPDTSGSLARYTVTNRTDQNITLDSNSPLAGKTLRFQVTLLSLQKANS